MKARWLLGAMMLCFPEARELAAQSQPGTTVTSGIALRGTVIGATERPLAFAIVSIASEGLQQFTNNQGKFYFQGLRPGKYAINVRQLGYLPYNVDVTLGAKALEDVRIPMQRLATNLAAMQVTGEWTCENPGRPAQGASEQLLQVFEQLEQNALRMQLLTSEFPFGITTERRLGLEREDGTDSLERMDTLQTVSLPNAGYSPGNVVRRTSGFRSQYFLQIPTLLDFADSTFQRNHCFLLRGVDASSGQPRIRVDFQPSGKIKSPDVAGSVFLDSTTYRLVSSDIRLRVCPAFS